MAGLERRGREKWQASVFEVVEKLKAALVAEYVLLGGGNVKKLTELPPGAGAATTPTPSSAANASGATSRPRSARRKRMRMSTDIIDVPPPPGPPTGVRPTRAAIR